MGGSIGGSMGGGSVVVRLGGSMGESMGGSMAGSTGGWIGRMFVLVLVVSITPVNECTSVIKPDEAGPKPFD